MCGGFSLHMPEMSVLFSICSALFFSFSNIYGSLSHSLSLVIVFFFFLTQSIVYLGNSNAATLHINTVVLSVCVCVKISGEIASLYLVFTVSFQHANTNRKMLQDDIIVTITITMIRCTHMTHKQKYIHTSFCSLSHHLLIIHKKKLL